MILAAGEGTRLRPLTATVPKPMIPIVGKPLLAWTLDWLATQGVTEAAVNLFHRPQAIADFFGDAYAGIRLHYFFEETLRGTSGGVLGARAILADEPFFVIYGDNLIHADLTRLAEFHASHPGIATVALFHHPNPTAAGIVATDKTGRITRFVEKPPPDQIFADTANAGVYVLDPAVLDAIPADGPSDFGRDIFPALLAQGEALYGVLLGGYLHDTGTPDQYRQANWDALAGRVGNKYAETRAWAGPGLKISGGATLSGRNILGRDVWIGDGASLTDCIVWDDVRIGEGVSLEQAIIGRGAVLDSGTVYPAGVVLGGSDSDRKP